MDKIIDVDMHAPKRWAMEVM